MLSRLAHFRHARVRSTVPATALRCPGCAQSHQRPPSSRSFSSVPPASVFRVSEEVQHAIFTGKPVVALETAIVTHGMPEPHNVDVAHMVEGRVRSEGAVPATVGLLDGKIVVGLKAEELKLLAEASQEKRARKVSRRDLPVALAENCMGGTTVSATMMAAHWAGVHVFVTGGIGGVHRDGENSLDVSADLTELGRTPVAVVCAGCKSILDIGRTLEYLETQGVPTITLGEQLNFPAFFAPDSGFAASHRVSSAEECARIIDASLQLGVENGIVIGVPIPSEEGKAVDTSIHQALEEAQSAGVAGRDVTPFVLRRVNELSAGKSLQANIELIKNNATMGSRIAAHLSQISTTRHGNGSSNMAAAAGGGGHFGFASRPSGFNNTSTLAGGDELADPRTAYAHSQQHDHYAQHHPQHDEQLYHHQQQHAHYHHQQQQQPQHPHLRHHASPTAAGATFGSLPPPPPMFNMSSAMHGDGHPPSLGNTPPPGFADSLSSPTDSAAAWIDDQLNAEFQQLVPNSHLSDDDDTARSVRPPNSHLGNHDDTAGSNHDDTAGSVRPPNQPSRRYHSSSRRRLCAQTHGKASATASQSQLDSEHFARRGDDVAQLESRRCPIVIGAAVVDIVARPRESNIQLYLTNDCQLTTSFGGVGRNVAEALIRCGQPTLLISAVGAEESQAAIVRHFESVAGPDQRWCSLGMRPCLDHSTATYIVVLEPSGDLFTGVGNFDVAPLISTTWLRRFERQLQCAPVVVLDCNLAQSAIDYLLTVCGRSQTPVWFEPTCTAKAGNVYATSSWQHITVASPNIAELQVMARAISAKVAKVTGGGGEGQVDAQLRNALSVDVSTLASVGEKQALCSHLVPVVLPYHPCLLVTLDRHGVLLARRRLSDDDVEDESTSMSDYLQRCVSVPRGPLASASDITTRLYPLPEKVASESIVSVSGAGDSLVGGFLAYSLHKPSASISDCVSVGLKAAQTSLSVSEAISPALSMDALLASTR